MKESLLIYSSAGTRCGFVASSRRRGLKIRSSIILLFIVPTYLFGQRQEELKLRPDILRFGDGVLYTCSAPTRWNGKDWLVLGGLVAGTTALTFLDQPVRDFWKNKNGRLMDGLERVGYHYGKPYTALAFTGGF